jgi:hypothetical protein
MHFFHLYGVAFSNCTNQTLCLFFDGFGRKPDARFHKTCLFRLRFRQWATTDDLQGAKDHVEKVNNSTIHCIRGYPEFVKCGRVLRPNCSARNATFVKVANIREVLQKPPQLRLFQLLNTIIGRRVIATGLPEYLQEE